MLVYGGESSIGKFNDLWEFDPVTGAWSQIYPSPGIPNTSSGHAAVWTGYSLVVLGGIDFSGWYNGASIYAP